MKSIHFARLTIAAIAASLLALPVNAFDFEVQMRSGIGASDNVTRSPQNEIDETIASAGFDFAVTEETRRLDLDLNSQFDYVAYLDDTFDSELIGGVNAIATVALVEERLQWFVSENYGQQLLNPLAPSTPGNRENVNFFATGPTLNLLPAGRNQIRVDLRYSSVDFEVQDADSNRLSAGLSIGRNISPQSLLSLNAISEQIEYDDTVLAPDFDRHEVFVRLETTTGSSAIEIDVGATQVDLPGESRDGLIGRLRWVRQVSVNGSFTLAAATQFSDQGNIFSFNQTGLGDLRDTVNSTNSPEPFVSNTFSMGYVLRKPQYQVDASLNFGQEDFDGASSLDRDVGRLRVRLRRDLTRTVFASVEAVLGQLDYQNPGLRDDDFVFGVGVGYRFSAGFSVAFDYRHFRRDSASSNGNFTENRALVSVIYVPVWSRR